MTSRMTLPTPTPAFRWTTETWGAALRCAALEGSAQHLFTTRQLALRAHAPGEDAWLQVAAALDVRVDRIARVKQVHGDSVRIIRRGESQHASSERPDGDAIVSNEPGLALAVQVADCAPILIADSRAGVAAAVHAGWRGTAARVVWAAIDAMQREFGAQAEDMTAAVGPSIGPCCYEVGEELIAAFSAAGIGDRYMDRWFTREPKPDGGESLRLDVPRANRDQLIAAGIRGENVHLCGLCTQTHQDVFDSYRADREAAGRMAAVIVVPARSA